MASMTIAPDHDAIVSEICIAAPPERIFQPLVEPQQVLQWWGQGGSIVAPNSRATCVRVRNGAAPAGTRKRPLHRGGRVRGSRFPSPVGLLVGRELERRCEDQRPLGLGAGRKGNAAQNPAQRTIGPSRGRTERPRVDENLGLAAVLYRKGRNDRDGQAAFR
jgi:hypothetical protein